MDITIGIGTWNASKYLDQVIDGILLQKLPIIAIDNESEDSTREILTRRGIEFTSFKHSKEKWINVYGIYKTLAEQCKSEYIFFVDHDVLLSEDSVKLAYDYFQSLPNPGAVAINYGGNHPNMGATLFKTEIVRSFEWVPAKQGGMCSCRYAASQLAKLKLTFTYVPNAKVNHLRVVPHREDNLYLSEEILQKSDKVYLLPKTVIGLDKITKTMTEIVTGYEEYNLETSQNKINQLRKEMNAEIKKRDAVLKKRREQLDGTSKSESKDV